MTLALKYPATLGVGFLALLGLEVAPGAAGLGAMKLALAAFLGVGVALAVATGADGAGLDLGGAIAPEVPVVALVGATGADGAAIGAGPVVDEAGASVGGGTEDLFPEKNMNSVNNEIISVNDAVTKQYS